MNGSKVTVFINPEQAVRCMRVCRSASIRAKEMGMPFSIPVALIGATGCGKTTAVNIFHTFLKALYAENKISFGLYILLLGTLPSEDLAGIPSDQPENNKIIHKMLDCLPMDSEEHCIIFADEYDRSPPETQGVFMQFLLGGNFHGHHLSPNAWTVLALNGSSDIHTTQMSNASATRLCTLFMSSKAAGSAEAYKDWSFTHGLPEICRSFHDTHPDDIGGNVDFEEIAECDSRTVDMAGFILDEIDICRDDFRTDDLYDPLIQGIVGSVAGNKMLALRSMLLKNVSAFDIFDDPVNRVLPDNTDQMYYLLDSACNIINHKFKNRVSIQDKKIDACLQYGTRFDKEEWKEAWFSRICSEKFPRMNSHPSYLAWQKYKQNNGIMV